MKTRSCRNQYTIRIDNDLLQLLSYTSGCSCKIILLNKLFFGLMIAIEFIDAESRSTQSCLPRASYLLADHTFISLKNYIPFKNKTCKLICQCFILSIKIHLQNCEPKFRHHGSCYSCNWLGIPCSCDIGIIRTSTFLQISLVYSNYQEIMFSLTCVLYIFKLVVVLNPNATINITYRNY